jgi:uncharacterized phiE125 gp8 family phage protein
MDNVRFIKTEDLYTILQAIPTSVAGDTVTISIKRVSDGYTWNFTTLAFENAVNTGTPTIFSGEVWKQTFTPPTDAVYLVTINDTTLDVKYYQYLESIGAPEPASYTPPAGAGYLTTRAKAKAYMKKTDTTDDTLMTALVAAASKRIQNYLNREVIQATYTNEIYDGTGSQDLFTKQYPIVSVASIKLYDPISNTDQYTYVVNTDYYLHADGEKILMWAGWRKGLQKYKITYVAGYAVSGETSAVPEDIELACNMLVAFYFNNIGKQNIESWRAGSYSETLKGIGGDESGIPAEIRGMLDIHRTPTTP